MSTQEYVIRRHRLTVDEYFRMAETGILAPDARVELIEGEIIDMAPIGNPHSSVVNQLTDVLAAATREFAMVQVQGPLTLGRHSQPQPDLTLFKRRADYYRSAPPTIADVLLVVEVADTTLGYDRGTKVPLYARHGIPEVWLFDLRSQTVQFFREPADGEYRHATSTRSPGVVTIRGPGGALAELDLGPVLL